MNSNERRLLLLLLLAVVIWGCLQFLPARPTSTSTATLTSQIDTARTELELLQKQQRSNQSVLARALTNDIPQATTLCQTWLWDLGQSCQLTNISLTPFPPQAAEQELLILPLTLAATGTQAQAGDLLHRLAQCDVEHRIRHWSLVPQEKDLPRLTVELDILCAPQGRTTAIAIPESVPASETWTTITQKLALPAHTKSIPTTANPRPPVATRPPQVSRWKLVGIVAESNRHEAWFVDAATQRQHKLTDRSTLQTAQGELRIAAINTQGVTLLHGDQHQHLRPGQTVELTLVR